MIVLWSGIMVNLAALQKYSLFGGLLPEEIERIRPHLEERHFEAGEDIVREGRPNDRVYFILDGRVAITKAGVLIVEMGEGDTFGEMELLDVMPSAASVTALLPTAVATISNRALHEIYQTNVRTFALIVMNLARELSRHLRRMDDLLTGQPHQT